MEQLPPGRERSPVPPGKVEGAGVEDDRGWRGSHAERRASSMSGISYRSIRVEAMGSMIDQKAGQ